MCGICGIINHNKVKVDKNVVKRMREKLSHRGPNQNGYYFDDNIGFGHSRLSIIDLSDNGLQPMTNDNGKLVIVYNGEIYNYKKLRCRLKELGHKFKSNTDTEVILKGYQEWGNDIVEKLKGMFAFVIYDKVNAKAIMARDRLGQKPFWYYQHKNSLIFSSEIGSILEYFRKTPSINAHAIAHYLSFSIIPTEIKLFDGVKQFEPGNYMIFNNGLLKKTMYWDVVFKNNINITKNEIKKNIDNKLNNSITRHIVSDVPVGTFLSGGLDSSLITALTAIKLGKNLHTFSIGFDSRSHDESKYAEQVSKRYSTLHHNIKLNHNCLNILPKLIYHYGEPFADFSAIPTYYVSKLAKKYVTVVLSGDGADEFFGGYSAPIRNYFYNHIRKYMPMVLMKKLNLLRPLKNRITGSKSSNMRHLINYIDALCETTFQNYINRNDKSWYLELDELISSSKINKVLITSYYKSIFNKYNYNDINKLLYLNIKTNFINDMLKKVDIASMANSLEVRCPFLDEELIEFISEVDTKYKFKATEGKIILKEVAEKYLPKNIVWRKKMGFTPPLGKWLRITKWEKLIHKIINNSQYINQNFNKQLLNKILLEHKNGVKDHEVKIWSIVWLALWYEIFINKSINKDTELQSIY